MSEKTLIRTLLLDFDGVVRLRDIQLIELFKKTARILKDHREKLTEVCGVEPSVLRHELEQLEYYNPSAEVLENLPPSQPTYTATDFKKKFTLFNNGASGGLYRHLAGAAIILRNNIAPDVELGSIIAAVKPIFEDIGQSLTEPYNKNRDIIILTEPLKAILKNGEVVIVSLSPRETMIQDLSDNGLDPSEYGEKLKILSINDTVPKGALSGLTSEVAAAGKFKKLLDEGLINPLIPFQVVLGDERAEQILAELLKQQLGGAEFLWINGNIDQQSLQNPPNTDNGVISFPSLKDFVAQMKSNGWVLEGNIAPLIIVALSIAALWGNTTEKLIGHSGFSPMKNNDPEIALLTARNGQERP